MKPKSNSDETIKFINLYRSKPILWDINEISYKCFGLRNKAYEEIALEMRMEVQSVRKKIRTLRCMYAREKRRMVKRAEAGKNCVRLLRWFREMSFLDGPIFREMMDNSPKDGSYLQMELTTASNSEDYPQMELSTASNLKDESYLTNEEIEPESDSMNKNIFETKIVPDYLNINSEDKNLNIEILQLYKHKPELWKYNLKIASDKDLCRKGYESIAAYINTKFSRNLSWLCIKNRINEMRLRCCDEIEKQHNGEKFQMPWYFEHIENVMPSLREIVKARIKYKLSRRIDDSILLIVIELYEKYEELWQVNNVYFGIFSKRNEIYNRMIVELKSDYNKEITLKDLNNYINYINSIFSKDKERELRSELHKSDFSPASNHYEKLRFLKDAQGPFKCSHCNNLIEKFEDYHIHVAEHTDTMPFKCLLCESDFKKYRYYIKHVEYHLKKDESSYRCDICGKCFALNVHLRNHKQTHNYVCQICDASFGNSSAYDRHKRRHENGGRFECHICKLGFKQLSSLNNHIKSHLNVRDFVCNICGKGFISNISLHYHKNVHYNEKRFKCHICGKEYARKSSLYGHRIRKHELYSRKTKREKEEPELE